MKNWKEFSFAYVAKIPGIHEPVRERITVLARTESIAAKRAKSFARYDLPKYSRFLEFKSV